MSPRALALLLVLLIAGRHQLVDVLALLFDDHDRARRALFYIAGGANLAALYAILWRLCRKAGLAIHLACLWGIVEESQVAVCRAVAGIETQLTPPMWRGICDGLAGAPMSTVTLVLPVCVAYLVFAGEGRKHG